MELKQYAAILWRWWWLLVISTVVAGTLALGISRSLQKVYVASTTLLINQAPSTSTTADYTSLITSERLAQTYAQMMRSRDVLAETIANLQLEITPQDLAGQVTVAPVRDTQLMTLRVEDVNPDRAAAIANEIVQAFIRQNQALQSNRYQASSQNLQQELVTLQEALSRTQQQLDGLGSPQGTEQQAEYNRLDALMAQYRTSYANVLQSYELVRLAEANTLNNVNVLESALPPTAPIRPQPLRNGMLAAIAGAMAALGVIFLIEYLDDSIKNNQDVEKLIGRSSLGAIALIDADTTSRHLVSLTAPRSPVSEAFRVLRANIKFSEVDHPIRSMLITSSGAAEGKSTVTANLAVVTAQSGKRVILVDADMRKPTVHKTFELTNAQGLTTALLTNAGPVGAYLQPTDVPGLQILTSGPLPPNPAELLGSQRMADLVTELLGEADVVMFDSPPLLAMADAALLARICDGTLLVAQADATRREIFISALDQLQKSGARLIGVVLNQVSTRRGSYYYYYQYQYDRYADGGEDGKKINTRRWPWSKQTDRPRTRRGSTPDVQPVNAKKV